ncbi:MAG: diaminopropionate ammonia-lyase [Firmicutes bacterium]|nr:diaminopropionate ammonia-lyase [Bacillota bacterium]
MSKTPIKWEMNRMTRAKSKNLEIMKPENVAPARQFHKTFPQYDETPLASLDNLAERLGLGGLYVKDESYRFGLKAFKVLGGSYAMGKFIAEKMGKDISQLSYDYLTSSQFRDEFGQATFFTATDGNHGMGIAWAANKLGQKAIIHMPKGTTQERYERIAREGAQVTVEDLNYDDCVRLAAKESEGTDFSVVIQDTSWEGYEKIPTWIMQGYGTLVDEAIEQLKSIAEARPTHVIIQAGVGCLASAVVGLITNLFPENPPKFIIAEAENAACFYKSALEADGEYRICTGDLSTIMAGLSCGEPMTIGWDIIKNCADAFLACPNWVTAKGMRILSSPKGEDARVVSGESGAVGVGAIAEIMQNDDYADLRKSLGLGKDSRVLAFSTEGDTDPEMYDKIVWEGAYQSF